MVVSRVIRATWLMQNEGLSKLAAQEKVMREFPSQFSGVAMGGIAVSGDVGLTMATPGLSVEVGPQVVTTPACGLAVSGDVGLTMATPGLSVAVGPLVATTPAIGVSVSPPVVALSTPPAMSVAICPPVRQAGPRACFKCKGRGFSHESTMTHDKGPGERCFFCENCSGCGGSGMIDAVDQACFKCEGKGFCHNSSMTHDKGPSERCFFCEKCSGCDGIGRINGRGKASTEIATGGSFSTTGGGFSPYPQGDMAVDCKNCTIL